MFKKLSLLLSALLVAVALAACNGGGGGGSNPVLQNYLDENREEMEAGLAAFGDVGIDITIDVGSGNELVFTFELSDDMYEEAREGAEMEGLDLAELLDEALQDLSPIFVMMADQVRDETELDNVTITVVYRGGGSQIASQSFDSE